MSISIRHYIQYKIDSSNYDYSVSWFSHKPWNSTILGHASKDCGALSITKE